MCFAIDHIYQLILSNYLALVVAKSRGHELSVYFSLQPRIDTSVNLETDCTTYGLFDYLPVPRSGTAGSNILRSNLDARMHFITGGGGGGVSLPFPSPSHFFYRERVGGAWCPLLHRAIICSSLM